jgi:streptogramin lyase
VAIAVDASHNVWVANQSAVTVTKVSPDGKTFTDYACCNGASGLAIDPTGNIWVANYYGDSVSEISSTGSIISNGYTSNGTIYHPQGIAADGAGNIWVANFRAGYLTELAGASSTNPGQPISPAAGWAPDSNLFGAFAVAIDATGNLWVTNFNNNSITEFVGIASPVKTPLLGPARTP